jgi:hypothetical protein
MILFEETQYGYLHEYAYSGVPTETGMAMIKSTDAAGTETVVPSTGAANERFAGISFADKHLTATGVQWDLPGTIPSGAPFEIQLPKTNNIVRFSAVRVDGGAFTAAPTVTSTGLVTFDPNDAEVAVLLRYAWTLSLQEQQWRSVSPVPPTASSITNTIPLAVGHCRVSTNSFDTSLTFTVGEDLRLGAGGLITNTGSGTVFGHCFKVPTSSEPFLGVEYNV